MKKAIPEVFARSVMSLYEAVKTKVRMYAELAKESDVKVGMYQASLVLGV